MDAPAIIPASNPAFDIDLSTQDYLAAPWRALRRIAERTPVFWSANLQGWILTRHADVKAAYADSRLSSARLDMFLRAMPEGAAQHYPNFVKYHALSVNFMDPPQHSRVRTLMMKAFSAQQIQRLQPTITAIVDDILRQAGEAREFEFHALVSSRLPTRVIQALLGVPSEVSDEFFRLANDVLRATDTFPPTDAIMMAADAAIVRLNALFSPLIEERHLRPSDDILSGLVRARDVDDRLGHDELLAACHAIVEGGSETTAHMLAVGLYEIAKRPELQSLVKSGTDGALRVVNELLRHPGLVMGMTRIVKEPLDLHAQSLKPGDIVFMMNAAANADPDVFERPEEIDPDRDVTKSLAFGPGLHFCIGHYLAKAELSAFFHAAFSRFEIEITEPEPRFIASWVFHGFERLHVRFLPR